MSRWSLALICGLLMLITLAVYWRVIGADFVFWDDNIAIYHNKLLGGLSWDRVRWAFTDFDSTMRYVPLSLLSWATTYQLGGMIPRNFHLGNLLLHAANVGLLFIAILLLWSSRRAMSQPSSTVAKRQRKTQKAESVPNQTSAVDRILVLCAALGALLWGLHPLRVEPVAWCTARTYDQATFFLLLSLISYLRSTANGTNNPARTWWYWASVLAFAASLLSHPVGLGFVAVLMIIDVYPLGLVQLRGHWWLSKSFWRSALLKLPYLAVVAGVVAVTLEARFHYSRVFHPAVSFEQFGMFDRLMQAMYLWSYYAWRPWWPVHLSPVYTTLVSFSPFDWRFIASAILVVSTTVALFAMRRRVPLLLTLWLCHLALLFPVLGWTEHPHYPSDRYSLLAGMLWSILLVAALKSLWRLPGRRNLALTATAACAAIILCLGAMTVRQTAVWKNSFVLFDHMIRVLGDDPYRSDIYGRLGRVYLQANPPDVVAAERAFKTGVDSNPHSGEARALLARVWIEQGRASEVLALVDEGLRWDPTSFDLHFGRAVALGGLRRFDESITEFNLLLKSKPDYAPAQLGLQAVLKAKSESGQRP